jgi:biopolymer transport protein ExbB
MSLPDTKTGNNMKITQYMSICLMMSSANVYANVTPTIQQASSLDLIKVFQSCPIIYAVLILMSLTSFAIWLYSLITWRLSEMMPNDFVSQLRMLLVDKHFDAALALCDQNDNFVSQIIATGILSRKHGPQVMIDSMQSEGRRCGNSLWQRIILLNEIAVIAPMIGLLGTVLGLFLAFYNNKHTAESIASIFDGLGVAVGTTVVGLIVAILAMIFYTTLKFRVISLLNAIENETLSLVTIIEVDQNSK